MRRTVFTLMLSIISLHLLAQNFEVPKSYKFEKIEDYAFYEQDIINCVNWMLTSPVNEQETKRKAAYSFLMQWVIGSPTVKIGIKTEIVNFAASSPGVVDYLYWRMDQICT
jgi:hypothetical protein